MLTEIDALLAVNDQVTGGYEIPHDLDSMMEVVFGGEHQPGEALSVKILEDARDVRETRAAFSAARIRSVERGVQAVGEEFPHLAETVNRAARALALFLDEGTEPEPASIRHWLTIDETYRWTANGSTQ
jgi:hypothetical protein